MAGIFFHPTRCRLHVSVHKSQESRKHGRRVRYPPDLPRQEPCVAAHQSPTDTRQHLGYCTNVHPYSDLEGMLEALESCAAPVRQRLVSAGRLAPDAPLGVGLWFPAPVATEVVRNPARLREALERLSLDAFTVNAFPHGVFHGDVVKDAVFRPEWGHPRLHPF